jgi:predicted AAA+ superfamily ATPase
MTKENEDRQVLERLASCLARIEHLLPKAAEPVDWNLTMACRWREHAFAGGHLQPLRLGGLPRLVDLQCIDSQKRTLDTNTRQFLKGLPANNALLWGPRGTGKSSLVKALLAEYAPAGLRLVELHKQQLADLPEVVDRLHGRPERFVVFCDDLSFGEPDADYKSLKIVLDGSAAATPANVVVYATSNRRHLLPESRAENLEARNIDGEIHHGEAVEEKISLSERFGLWLAFHPFSQEQYLGIVRYWLGRLDIDAGGNEAIERHALQWALLHGTRSGRSAWQFAKDWAGRAGLGETPQ